MYIFSSFPPLSRPSLINIVGLDICFCCCCLYIFLLFFRTSFITLFSSWSFPHSSNCKHILLRLTEYFCFVLIVRLCCSHNFCNPFFNFWHLLTTLLTLVLLNNLVSLLSNLENKPHQCSRYFSKGPEEYK